MVRIRSLGPSRLGMSVVWLALCSREFTSSSIASPLWFTVDNLSYCPERKAFFAAFYRPGSEHYFLKKYAGASVCCDDAYEIMASRGLWWGTCALLVLSDREPFL